MAVSRKEKESFLGKNLFFLRKGKGKTLEEMAEMLELNSKSSYKAYEEERALPDIHKVMRLASYFDVAVADLIYRDLSLEKQIASQEPRKMHIIQKVPFAAAAGYARGFESDDFLVSLDTLQIPFEPYGIARGFEIAGDSMEPEIADRSVVVGIKVSNDAIKDNKAYIVVTRDGLQCKRVRPDDEGNYVYLISANSKYHPKHVRRDEIIEMWEVWKTL
ncbi:MAG: XRE family transcriptional regulator [Flavobacteriales bacterium]